MAKQTFTTGQVLTAAQMTSLQQTAMLGGNAAVKTTSYVLVAADAGTSVAMNSTSATTVTVNTGLFAAGDTVTIINQNTGVCTVTAGTATVRKASGASLALSQYQGGVLNFISASEAIFFPFDVGSASPLTTKGDLYVFSTTNDRLAIGTTNQVLTVDSTTASGMKWATASGGAKSWSLVNAGGTALTAAKTITVSGITKDNLMIIIEGASSDSAASHSFRFSGDTGANYAYYGFRFYGNSAWAASNLSRDSGGGNTLVEIGVLASNTASTGGGYIRVEGCKSTSAVKTFDYSWSASASGGSAAESHIGGGIYSGTSAITSFSYITSGVGNFDAGTLFVYESD